MVARIDDSAPELGRALHAVFRVSRAARTLEQRAAASSAANRWTALALQAGWSRTQIAEAVGVRPAAISQRARRGRHCLASTLKLHGVLAVPTAPLSERTQARLHRQRLIGPAEVARLFDCKPGSVTCWAMARNVPFQWTAGGRKRLYERDAVLAAARQRPTKHYDRGAARH